MLPQADALIVRSETQVTAEVLAAGHRLRVVARAGVGIDNIDVPSATAAGILVLNAPGANAVSAAEHTIALLLALTRSIPDANNSTHAGKWERKRFKPFDLKGKVIGIVGLGHVGSALAQRLNGFEPRLIGHDPYITRERFQQLGVEPVSYETLLETADVVTFHVPATPETVHMLDAAAVDRSTWRAGPELRSWRDRGRRGVGRRAAGRKSRRGGGRRLPTRARPREPALRPGQCRLTPHIGGSSKEALATVGQMISRPPWQHYVARRCRTRSTCHRHRSTRPICSG